MILLRLQLVDFFLKCGDGFVVMEKVKTHK